MTACPYCNQPLEPIAAVRTYHGQCDPQGRVEMLERALECLADAVESLSTWDGETPSRLVVPVERARAALAYKPAQMKGREG